MKLKIKKGDKVIVISGADKGKTGVVKEVFPTDMKLLIDSVNLKKKHSKPSQKNQAGGIESIARPIHYSKVMLTDAAGKPTRVGFKITNTKGKITKTRIAKTTGAELK